LIENKNMTEYVGREKFTSDRLYEITPPGVIMGLAWTSMGGSVLYIEASLGRRLLSSAFNNNDKSAEQGSLETTGHLGDVMKVETII
jgi:Lon-like ATP-dependent protease